ncbi:MAG: hypothetical protein ACLQCU_02245, partial [Acidimicrobiales bacterium]
MTLRTTMAHGRPTRKRPERYLARRPAPGARASSVVIGDPGGVRDRDAGAVRNRRTHRWLVVHTTRALCHRLEEVGT